LNHCRSFNSTKLMGPDPSLRFYLAMSDSELREVFESSGQKRPSDLFVVVGAPFALLMAGTALFGGFEFNEPSKFDHMTSKKCLMAAICYARGDDLLIFAAASLKLIVVFGMPLGTIAVVGANMTLPKR
jgi:hypothetical protein